MSKTAMRTAWLVVLGVAVGPGGAPRAAAESANEVGPIEVRVLPQPTIDSYAPGESGTNHGYVELRVQLKNRSKQDQEVHLSYPDEAESWGGDDLMVTRSVNVGQGQQVVVSLFLPPGEAGRPILRVRVTGVRDPKDFRAISLYRPYTPYDSDPRGVGVLLSRSVPLEFRDGMETKPEAKVEEESAALAPVRKPRSEAERFTFLRSELPVSQWSPNWLGYSAYDCIVLTGEDVEGMPADVQTALRRYLECGGTVLLHAKSMPAIFAKDAFAGINGECLVGLGQAVASQAAGRSDWKKTYQRLIALRVEPYWPTSQPSNLRGMLVEQSVVPVRGLFLLVLLFGVAIGPANLWLLSRYKRRIWLWWNVPALSLVTCLAVFGYSLVAEGWTGYGKTASVTLLDERCHRATTFGYLSYYCPLTPRSGLHLSTDTDVALLQDSEHSVFQERDSLRTVDWTRDQHLASGWVNAKASAYFQFRKNEDRRERLTLQKQADGSMTVLNALGADIRRLCLADSEGFVFEGHDIAAGARAALTPTGHRLSSPVNLDAMRRLFHREWLTEMSIWLNQKQPVARLDRGTYIAHLAQSPFVGASLEGATCEDSAAIVYGISKESGDGR